MEAAIIKGSKGETMKETRLEQLCKAFGWQGGTIHDANRQAAYILGWRRFDALSYTDEEFLERLNWIKLGCL
jgi:hypothetical protein